MLHALRNTMMGEEFMSDLVGDVFNLTYMQITICELGGEQLME